MKPSNIIKIIVLTVGCAALAFSGPNTKTVPILAHAVPSFVFTPTSDPYVVTVAANGVARVSLLGNCTEHADLVARFPATTGQPVLVSGSGTFSSSDGMNTLSFTVTGSATPDPANPAFLNAKYQMKFTGGTGVGASARGSAEIEEVILFNSPLTGTASWSLLGYVTTDR